MDLGEFDKPKQHYLNPLFMTGKVRSPYQHYQSPDSISTYIKCPAPADRDQSLSSLGHHTMIIVLLLGLWGLLFWLWWRKDARYWEKQGVPSLACSFPFGNVKDLVLMRTTIGEQHRDVYRSVLWWYMMCQVFTYVKCIHRY